MGIQNKAEVVPFNSVSQQIFKQLCSTFVLGKEQRYPSTPQPTFAELNISAGEERQKAINVINKNIRKLYTLRGKNI